MENRYEQRISQLENLVKDLTEQLNLTREYTEYIAENLNDHIYYTQTIVDKLNIDHELLERKKKLSSIINRMK